MDASVIYQTLESDACNFTSNGVMAGKGDGFGSVVYYQINAGERFKRADVSSFASDDASLHLVRGERNYRYGSFYDLLCSAALNSKRDNIAGLYVGLFFQAGFHLRNSESLFVGKFSVKAFKEIILCLFNGEARNLFEHIELAFFNGFSLFKFELGSFQLCGKSLFFLVEVVYFLVNGFFLVLNSAFKAGNLTAAFLDLAFAFGFQFEDLVFCFNDRFFFLGLSGLDGFADYSFCFIFGNSKFLFCDILSIFNACGKGNYNTDYKCNGYCYIRYHKFMFLLSSIYLKYLIIIPTA